MQLLKSIHGLLVTNPTNIRYLTGFVGVAPEEREAYILMTNKTTYLFTNSLYLEQAKQLTGVTVVQISRENPISMELQKLCDELGITRLGFEDANLTVAEFTKLKNVLTGIKLVPTQERIEELRMVKRKDEIESIRYAADLTDQCFKILLKNIRPGMTERKLAMYIEGFFKSRGAENAFAPIVAFNEHSSQPHYHELSNTPLRRGSLILLDFGARVNGYCADMSRVVFLGKPKKEWAETYTTVLNAQQKALDLLSSGERNGATLDAAAKEIIAEADAPLYSHSLGHGVGLDIHETPRLRDKKAEILKPDMVFSVEPGVYIEGQYGIRIEDLVRLTHTGTEVLSRSPRTLTVL